MTAIHQRVAATAAHRPAPGWRAHGATASSADHPWPIHGVMPSAHGRVYDEHQGSGLHAGVTTTPENLSAGEAAEGMAKRMTARAVHDRPLVAAVFAVFLWNMLGS